MLKTIRKTKIVATMGPACQNQDQIEALIAAGVDITRLNFSHGTHEFHAGMIKKIRQAASKFNRPIAIMQDLQGPKLRLGKLQPGGVMVKPEEHLLLYPEGTQPQHTSAQRTQLPISAEIAVSISQDVRVGSRILFDDGKISTEVLEVHSPEIIVKVLNGGKLSDHKGMNLPGTPLRLHCVTEKDLEDLKFGLEQGVDAVALSFVKTAKEIEDVKKIIKTYLQEALAKDPTKKLFFPLIIAKIEREEAVQHQDSIIEVIDGLLVARGDMAVELGAARVPTIQKRLIHACNELGVPVITATQMLESMIQSPTPTRAEASDVANAVFDGTDAVMLSAETASGQYPTLAVETMAKIIVESEQSKELYHAQKELIPAPDSIVDSIEFSASRIAHHVGARVIACLTHSGLAAKTLAKFRPSTPIVAIMDQEQNLRKLAFSWGVQGVLINNIVSTDDVFNHVADILLKHRWVESEDLIVVTAGVPTLRRGTTNTVKVHRVGGALERKPTSL